MQNILHDTVTLARPSLGNGKVLFFRNTSVKKGSTWHDLTVFDLYYWESAEFKDKR